MVFVVWVWTGIASLTKELDEFELRKTEARAVTGVLASHPNSTDVHISSLSLTFHGQELLADTSLELNSGRRYGLIGLNGTGEFCRGMFLFSPQMVGLRSSALPSGLCCSLMLFYF